MATKGRFYENAQFLELKKDWDQRLKDSGLDDIEEPAEEVAYQRLKHQLRTNPGRCEALADYFTEAERALATTVFESPVDRAIWTHHARGASEREIAELVGVNRRTVQRRLEKYRKRLGLVRPR